MVSQLHKYKNWLLQAWLRLRKSFSFVSKLSNKYTILFIAGLLRNSMSSSSKTTSLLLTSPPLLTDTSIPFSSLLAKHLGSALSTPPNNKLCTIRYRYTRYWYGSIRKLCSKLRTLLFDWAVPISRPTSLKLSLACCSSSNYNIELV